MPRTTSRQSRAVSINGPALRVIREIQGVAVADLTAALECDPSYFSHLETGRRRRCSKLFLAELCRVLGIEDRRALLACPYGEEEHEAQAPAHDALADSGPSTVELARPDIGENIPIIVSAPRIPPGAVTPRVPAPELVPEPRPRPRPTAKHRSDRGSRTAKR